VNSAPQALLVSGPQIAAYGFPGDHPFGTDRHAAFIAELERSAAASGLERLAPVAASTQELLLFHTPDYVERVRQMSRDGRGYLDAGDTPAWPGVFEAASYVVGSTLLALRRIATRAPHRAFVPIAGLHHATRNGAAGFCVFNDCGVAIELARQELQIRKVAYVDIDAHHGDGVFYGFEDDPDVIFADIHEDGRYLYPGTGRRDETGIGAAAGTKLNVPLLPGADDTAFLAAWEVIEAHVAAAEPELIILQCGADSLAGDPLTHLAFSEEAHAHAAGRLRAIAARCCGGRLLALGGGGYDRGNLGRAWTRVCEALI
jgi:acetoin utilization protein AcuC